MNKRTRKSREVRGRVQAKATPNAAPQPPPEAAPRLLRSVGVALLLTAAVGMAGWYVFEWASSPRTVPISEVVIEGEFVNLDRKRLEAQAWSVVTGGFFAVDIGAIAAVLAEDQWVRGVAIRREWPGRLRITVLEQVAVARWGRDSLLNPMGESFRPAQKNFPPGLPHLEGMAGREREVLIRFARTQEELAGTQLEVVSVVEDARRAVVIGLADGVEIFMGRGADDGRLARLARSWPQVVAVNDAPLRKVDLRYTNGFAVSWRNGGETQELQPE